MYYVLMKKTSTNGTSINEFLKYAGDLKTAKSILMRGEDENGCLPIRVEKFINNKHVPVGGDYAYL